ncbi:MAG: DNA repair protein RecO [Gemmatimonadetes bacterium]|nr:DNA repair protein RecO [Gemmatimonadota bacterium]NNM07172.1 DNA repair protein RecO [Gemmatimonadota bacterium]
MALLSTTAILLRSYPFSETSQILRFYSDSHGVLAAMAKGVRRSGGKRGGALRTFSEGILSVGFRDNRDLQTFREFSTTRTRPGLGTDPVRLAAASVLGELILQHAEGEGNPLLFASLGRGMDRMESAHRNRLLSDLLVHLWSLIQGLGFGPVVHECVQCGSGFSEGEMGRFDFSAGGLRCHSCQESTQGPRMGPVARAQLHSLLDGRPPEELTKPLTHLRVASDFVTYHISGGTPLRSMAVLGDLIARENA